MICHFSCGATSAIATAIALKEDPTAEVVYADTGSEHPDNMRFLKDCEERLFKKKVTIVKSKRYKNVQDVVEQKKFLSGPAGAPCTSELKKIPIRDYIGERLVTELQVYGFDKTEMKRIERYRENNPEVTLDLPLIRHDLIKPNCLALIDRFEIEMPAMYKLGYPNANCIGCVKAENLKYWAAIREDFPETFKWYAETERKLGKVVDGKPRGAAINKRYIKGVRNRVFLDELPEDIEPKRDIDMWCGYSCGSVSDIIGAPIVEAEEKETIEDVFDWLVK